MNIKIIKASAGSGKTFCLTSEYLGKIFKYLPLNHQQNYRDIISSVLAITFTNKAAGEMRGRIIEILKSFSLNDREKIPEKDIKLLDQIKNDHNIDEVQVLDNSEEFFKAIIDNYNDFNVKTIDSLMAQMIKVLSPDLDISSPDFDIGINPKNELTLKSKQFIDYLASSDWNYFQKILDEMLSIGEITRWNAEDIICENLVALFTKHSNSIEKLQDNPAETAKYKSKIDRNIENLRKNLAKFISINKDPEIAEEISGSLVRKETVAKIQNFVETGDLNIFNEILKSKLFTYGNAAEIMKKKHTGENLDKLSPVYEDIKGEISNIVYYYSLCKSSYHKSLLISFMDFWKEHKSQLYLDEFGKLIRDLLLSWDKSFSYLYFKLSEQYIHYLIDEFQDTSETQFNSLAPLISEQLNSNSNSSLFLVGDIKQAIYRFRGGEVNLMKPKNIYANLEISPENKIIQQTLDKNWRSARDIVEFNNEFWEADKISRIFTDEQLVKLLQENFEDVGQLVSESNQNEPGYIEININHKNQIESEDISSELNKSIQEIILKCLDLNYQPRDIAILVRKNDDIRKIFSYLVSQKIPVVSDESMLLSSSPLIMETVSFLKFLNSPLDNLNFYAFITGEIFNKLIGDDNFIENFNQQIINPGEKIYKIFKDNYPQYWEKYFFHFFNYSGFLPVYDLYQDYLAVFELYENFEHHRQYLINFAELLHDLERVGINTIPGFLNKWETVSGSSDDSRVVLPETANQVKLITMHSAKGLQFPVVIIPLYGRSNKNDNIFIAENQLYHIKKNFTKFNEKLNEIYNQEAHQRCIDELNLLYVAMTRAEKMLFITGVHQDNMTKKDDDEKQPDKLIQFFIYHPFYYQTVKIENSVYETRGTITARKETQTEQKNYYSLEIKEKKFTTDRWNRDYLRYSSKTYEYPEQKQVMHRGEIIHSIMSELTIYSCADELYEDLKIIVENFKLDSDGLKNFSGYFNIPQFIDCFVGDWEFRNELELADPYSNKYYRIDRVVWRDNQLIVLEYKSGNDQNPDYLSQVRNYMKILSEIFPEKSVSGRLAYLDLKKMEMVDG
ncbi:MAG: UvrD-helicase domain-containing protein [bacterium]